MTQSARALRSNAASRALALAYGLAVAAALGLVTVFWYALGRPVNLPDVLVPDGRMQCVSYTPFLRDQSPLRPFVIEREQVSRDFALLSRYFECVRTYSVVGLEMIPEVAAEHGLKVLLGGWVGVDRETSAREVEGLVELANRYPDVVAAVIVGNEVLLRRERTGEQMAELVRQVKARVRQPVTYADVWEFWRKHPEVAPAVDFLTIHLLPYWEDEPSGIDQALAQVRRVREEMGRQFAGKPILIGETGWPSEGRQRETAVPSRENQARFVRGFVALAESHGWSYNLIEAFDQPWKREKEGAVGGYWGLFDTDRIDKGVLAGPVSNLPTWRGWLAGSAGIAAVLLVLAGLPASRRGVLAPLLAAAGAALVVYHLHYGTVTARNPAEWIWIGAEATLSLATTLLLVLTVARPAGGWRRGLWRALDCRAGLLLLGLGFTAAVVALQLAFEPRYRDFPIAVYLLPALGFLGVRAAGLSTPAHPGLRWLGALLALAAPVVLVRETLANGPALAWVGVSLLLALALLWPGRRAPARA
ncbi:MAG: glycosyl hydrolase family 17 protein [Gammaproteobacteria bacterium]|nr:glycosyl hydrolase family 17 protein [Gammaproteobacteria bacterium]